MTHARWLYALWPLALLSGPVQAETLEGAWAVALAANPAWQASQASTESSRHLVNSAKAARWPTLSLGAVWAHHQEMPKVQLKAGPQSLDLTFPDGWLAANPLTQADFEQEAEWLTRINFVLTVR